MHTFTKSLLTSTALLAGQALADLPPPATQPATQPTTQPAAPLIAQSNDPLVIPDGTSPQNPGENFRQPVFRDGPMLIEGVRG